MMVKRYSRNFTAMQFTDPNFDYFNVSYTIKYINQKSEFNTNTKIEKFISILNTEKGYRNKHKFIKINTYFFLKYN